MSDDTITLEQTELVEQDLKGDDTPNLEIHSLLDNSHESHVDENNTTSKYERTVDYRGLIREAIRYHVNFLPATEFFEGNTDDPIYSRFMLHFLRARKELESAGMQVSEENLAKIFYEKLLRLLEKHRKTQDILDQTQGIEIEVLDYKSHEYYLETFSDIQMQDSINRNKLTWTNRISDNPTEKFRGIQRFNLRRKDFGVTQEYGIPEDEGERVLEIYEFSPLPSLTMIDQQTVLALLMYAGFIDNRLIERYPEHELYSLHISTTFPVEVLDNPEFYYHYRKLAKTLSVTYSSVQRLGAQSFIRIIEIKDKSKTNQIKPITKPQLEQHQQGRLKLVEMRGFNVNDRTFSLLLNKPYFDYAIRLMFSKNAKQEVATKIIEGFLSEYEQLIGDLLDIIEDPYELDYIASTMRYSPEAKVKFRKEMQKLITRYRRKIIEQLVVPSDREQVQQLAT